MMMASTLSMSDVVSFFCFQILQSPKPLQLYVDQQFLILAPLKALLVTHGS